MLKIPKKCSVIPRTSPLTQSERALRSIKFCLELLATTPLESLTLCLSIHSSAEKSVRRRSLPETRNVSSSSLTWSIRSSQLTSICLITTLSKRISRTLKIQEKSSACLLTFKLTLLRKVRTEGKWHLAAPFLILRMTTTDLGTLPKLNANTITQCCKISLSLNKLRRGCSTQIKRFLRRTLGFLLEHLSPRLLQLSSTTDHSNLLTQPRAVAERPSLPSPTIRKIPKSL